MQSRGSAKLFPVGTNPNRGAGLWLSPSSLPWLLCCTSAQLRDRRRSPRYKPRTSAHSREDWNARLRASGHDARLTSCPGAQHSFDNTAGDVVYYVGAGNPTRCQASYAHILGPYPDAGSMPAA